MSAFLQIFNGFSVVFHVAKTGEVQQPFNPHPLERFDQVLMDLRRLIAALGNETARLRVFEPDPLKDRRLVQGGRGICIVLQQFGWARPVTGKIEPAIEIPVPVPPAICDIVPIRLGNAQSLIDPFVRKRLVQQLEAHCLNLFRGPFEISLDLSQGEAVVSGFIPIGHPNTSAEFVAMLTGGFL